MTIKWKTWSTILLMLFCTGLCLLLLKAYFDGQFNSVASLREYINGFGALGPIILTLIQAAQVVLPVLPGFFGCAVGGVLFGWAGGFWCNYIGISLGSICAFLLARTFGQTLITKIFRGKRYDRWSSWAAKSKSFSTMLFLAMLLPSFPDDFLCYFTGITKMKTWRFIMIIIIGKPWCILAYSIFFAAAVS